MIQGFLNHRIDYSYLIYPESVSRWVCYCTAKFICVYFLGCFNYTIPGTMQMLDPLCVENPGIPLPVIAQWQNNLYACNPGQCWHPNGSRGSYTTECCFMSVEWLCRPHSSGDICWLFVEEQHGQTSADAGNRPPLLAALIFLSQSIHSNWAQRARWSGL